MTTTKKAIAVIRTDTAVAAIQAADHALNRAYTTLMVISWTAEALTGVKDFNPLSKAISEVEAHLDGVQTQLEAAYDALDIRTQKIVFDKKDKTNPFKFKEMSVKIKK